jgi:hypothetical protein
MIELLNSQYTLLAIKLKFGYCFLILVMERLIGKNLIQGVQISHQPFHDRWFPEGYGQLINLPFKHHDKFISRYEAPEC